MQWEVETGRGQVPIVADDESATTVVILAHGAGGHMDQKTVQWLAGLVRTTGARVVRFNFLYRVQGKSLPDRMPVLIESYRAVIESVRERLAPERLIIGGHSLGGRAASMLESEGQTANRLLLFGYPLHPAGQEGKLRDGHLGLIATPTLQINGTEDPLCNRGLMEEVLRRLDPAIWKMRWIEGADHSYAVKKASGRSRRDVEDEIEAALHEWVGR